MTNQCLVTNISAQYTLYMQPAGACVPIARIVNSTITPAPLLNASVQQAVCGSTLAVVSITPSGSAANPSTLSWSPTPVSINSGTTIASYAIPSGQAPMVVSISGTDPLGCLVTTTVNVNPAPPIPTFSIVNTSKSYSVTCFNPTVTLDATTNYSYNNGTLNYLWASASQTFVANSASIVTPGSYTVTATDPVTQCSTVQLVVVGVNTVAPLSIMTPSLQNITCTTAATNVTVTANPTINVTHMIMAPQGGTYVASSYSTMYTPGGVGNYTYCLRNDVNGCETCKEFTVTSNQSFPTFKLTSPQNFTVGCNTTSCAVISIDQGQGGGGGAVTYTVLPPGTSTVTSPGLLSPTSTYTVCAPGAYTVITKDNVSLCETRVPVSILQNTFAPNLSAIIPRTVLDCDNPSVQLKGLSNTENVEYSWVFVGTPNTVQADTVTAHIEGAPTKTLLNTYTLVINDLSSTCKSYSVVPIFQNIYPPRAAVTPITSSLTCLVPTVVLTNQSAATTPTSTGFEFGKPVVGFWWEGPTPQEPLSNSTSYVAGTPGVYTMTAKDMNNGCTSSTIVTVVDFRTPPIVNDPPPLPSVLDCGDRFVNLVPTITNPSPGYTYSWTAPATSTVGNATAQTFMAGATGEYNLRVYNPANGCATEVSMEVIDGALTTTFTPDQTEGFAPLAVNFTNGSSSTSGNSGVYSVWNFGNQTSVTYSTVQSASVVFNQPGTYTVTLHTAKGSCMGTAQRVIRVESPSSLEVPNVFTPNGDGANDLFFVKAKNLVEIQAVIFDRWGNVVYEVNSLTGNIEWDGKNSQGRVVAEGTYFYTIKAVGKDNTSYDKKGTISLIR
jgi:gliding motility-associated-like protein